MNKSFAAGTGRLYSRGCNNPVFSAEINHADSLKAKFLNGLGGEIYFNECSILEFSVISQAPALPTDEAGERTDEHIKFIGLQIRDHVYGVFEDISPG